MYAPLHCTGAVQVYRRRKQRTPSTRKMVHNISTVRLQMASSPVVTKLMALNGVWNRLPQLVIFAIGTQ